TERAVEPYGDGARVPHGVPERFHGLAGEDAARGVGDRARYHHRVASAAFLEIPVDRVERRLRVQGVEYGLDEEKIDAAFREGARLLEVGRGELVEGDVAGARVVHVGRD